MNYFEKQKFNRNLRVYEEQHCMSFEMKWPGFLALLILSVTCESENEVPVGLIDGLINATLEYLRPHLVDKYFEGGNFETGPQELGNFKGNIREVTVKGLENFTVKVLKTSLVHINNLTVVEEDIFAKGLYKINGILAFPLGKNDINVFGDGQFRANFNNFSISIKAKILSENGLKVVKDFDIFVGLEKMQVYLSNLMGGGESEEVFNGFINDAGLTVFEYYKEPILSVIKPKIQDAINDLLNKKLNDEINKTEL